MVDRWLLEVIGLDATYLDGNRPRQVLLGLSMELRRGELLFLCGKNGTGKSTLLKCLAGELPCGGSVKAGSVHGDRRGRICFVSQDVEEMVAYSVSVGEFLGLCDQAVVKDLLRNDRVRALVGQDGGRRLSKQLLGDLSGGEKRVVFGIAALAMRCSVLLLDEFADVLDIEMRSAFLKFLQQYVRGTGAGAIVVSHDCGIVMEWADRLAVIEAGRIERQVEKPLITEAVIKGLLA